MLHGSLSSHTVTSLAGETSQNPLIALQKSLVQALESWQTTGTPEQVPPPHLSAEVHGLPSLHPTVLAPWLQVPAASQPSSVHTLPSPHDLPMPLHLPNLHMSFLVQSSPSVHGCAVNAL